MFYIKFVICIAVIYFTAKTCIIVNTTRISTAVSNVFPDRKTCGPLSEEDRIFGGEIAAVDEFPWLVRLKYALKNGNEVYACAGSLITNRYIVTAAHCVVNLTIIEIRLGDVDNTTKPECFDGSCHRPIDLEIDSVIPFPGYSNRSMFKNDIALLRLKHGVNFTDFIRPICLPSTDFSASEDYVSENVYWTAGWGQTEFEKKSSVKRKVALEAVPMRTCRAAEPVISDDSAPFIICAGGKQGKDSCGGDSGGSLVKQVTESNSTNWYLFGITSYGYKDCGTEGRPGLYTRVTRYMDWIFHNIVFS